MHATCTSLTRAIQPPKLHKMQLRTGHFYRPYIQAALRMDYKEIKLVGCVTVCTDLHETIPCSSMGPPWLQFLSGKAAPPGSLHSRRGVSARGLERLLLPPAWPLVSRCCFSCFSPLFSLTSSTLPFPKYALPEAPPSLHTAGSGHVRCGAAPRLSSQGPLQPCCQHWGTDTQDSS